jgi:hypothetical protein
MVWVGKLSYPLYLVHWPILIFLKEHTEEFTPAYRILGFLCSFAAAAAVFYFVEKPLREGRILQGRKSYVLAIAASTIGTIAICGAIVLTEGLPGRFSAKERALLAARDDRPIRFESCERQATSIDDLCRLGDAIASPEVMIIGDSHAQALAGAFNIWLADSGRGGALAFHSGCMPVLGAGKAGCIKSMGSAIRMAEQSSSVKEVILVSIWRQALPKGGQPFLGRWVPEAEVPAVFEAQLKKTVTALEAAGKKVTIVDPLFAAPRSVPDTLAGNLAFGRDWAVNTPLAQHERTFAPVLAAMDRMPSVRRISLLSAFCDRKTCRAVVDGRPLFIDNNHLAQAHSAKVASIIESQAP